MYALPATPKTRLSLASAAILLSLSLAFIPLSALEHTRCIQPSATLELYFTVTIPLGVIQCDTLWRFHNSRIVAAVFTAMLGVRLLALLAEAQGKRRGFRSSYKEALPECTGGIFSMLTLFWVFPLLRKGYAISLSLRDLYPLQAEMASRTLLNSVGSKWTNGLFGLFK